MASGQRKLWTPSSQKPTLLGQPQSSETRKQDQNKRNKSRKGDREKVCDEYHAIMISPAFL